MAARDLDDRYHGIQDRERQHQKQLPTEDEPDLPPPVTPIHVEGKVGRNDPCPCGSGRKYKQCCAKKK